MSNANPPVNRYLDDKSMDHIDHALGRPVFPLRESYRNYFATDIRSDEAARFDASPHWELRSVTPDAMAFYCVTDAGRQALADHLGTLAKRHRAFRVMYGGYAWLVPAESRGKAKYLSFLTVREVDQDLTFRAFCERVTIARAA